MGKEAEILLISENIFSGATVSERLKLQRCSDYFNRLPIAAREPGRDTGGPDRDRTDDLIIANDALSQLSYRPIFRTGALYAGLKGFCQVASCAKVEPSNGALRVFQPSCEALEVAITPNCGFATNLLELIDKQLQLLIRG